ncbi:hypothetical protein Tco_1045999, partial [Tanacetum coccineum]
SSYFNANTKLEVDLAWAIKAKQAEHDKGKAKQAEHDLDDVDLNHVDLDGLDLENRVKKLEEDFSRMLKAKKAKEAKEAELKVNKEVVQVSIDEDPQHQELSTSAFKASTRSKSPIASTSNTQDASTSASRVYRRIAMTGCVLGLRALDDPNALPPSAPQKRKVQFDCIRGCLNLIYKVKTATENAHAIQIVQFDCIRGCLDLICRVQTATTTTNAHAIQIVQTATANENDHAHLTTFADCISIHNSFPFKTHVHLTTLDMI